MGKLGALYSRFRPIRLEEEDRLFAPVQMPGDLTVGSKERSVSPLAQMLSFSSTSSSSSISASASASVPSSAASFTEEAVGPRLVKHKIHLDVDEPFSQLCVVTNLARLGQSRGVFFNSAGVADGVVRAKRNWLAKRAATATEGRVGDGDDDDGEDRILWLNHDQVVGLKVKVDERTCARAAPVLMLRDEDPAIIYNIQYEGTFTNCVRNPILSDVDAELLVRTVRLLLAVEEALLQDYSSGSSKTMIFGSFVRPN